MSNPLRKQELLAMGKLKYNTLEFRNKLTAYIKDTPADEIEDRSLRQIKINYDSLRKTLPPRAEMYLQNQIGEQIKIFQRPKLGDYEKIYESQGVQVFLDAANVDQDYSPNSLYHRMVRHGVNLMLLYIKDILPNKKPRIVITDLSKNIHTKETHEQVPSAMAIESKKTIFIDWRHVDKPENYVHEYAHYVADLIPKQTEKLLIDAYKNMIDMYFRMAKRKRLDPSEISDKMRDQMAKKLGFPVYGLTDHHELFAVIIEYWKRFPTNSATYRFKSLVKNVLNRV